MPHFLCPGLVVDQEELVTSKMVAGKSLLLFFYPEDFGPEGETCLDVMAELAVAPELGIEMVAVSTDSLEVHRVWRERREAGGPGVMVADRTILLGRGSFIKDPLR